MAFRLILLIWSRLVLAKIDIQVYGIFSSPLNITVHHAGEDIGIITDNERNTFNLSDSNLKNELNLYYGKRPAHVYLHGPIPCEDFYEARNLHRVTRTLKPLKGKVLKTSSKRAVIYQQVYENNSTEPQTRKINIPQTIRNKISSSWSTEGELSICQNISYDIKLETASGKPTYFSYVASWGEDTTHNHPVTIGDTSSEIILRPGDSFISELQVTKGSIQFEVEYEAFLSGDIVVSHTDLGMCHHYWILHIDECMKKFGLSNRKVSREVVDIEFYADYKIINSF